jgi:signal transduction histidine kinase
MVTATRLIAESILDAHGLSQPERREPDGLPEALVLNEAPTLRDVGAAGENGSVSDPAKRSSAFAHEVRNCLHRAVLHLMLLERELERVAAGAEASDSAGGIRKEITRISSAVNDYLDGLKKTDSPKSPGLRELCLGATRLVARQAAEAGVEIASEFVGDVDADVDLRATERVLVHVLSHAVLAATPHSRVLLFCHGIGVDASIELSWELPDASAGAEALKSTLGVVSSHGGTVEVRTSSEHALVYVEFPVIQRAADRKRGSRTT